MRPSYPITIIDLETEKVLAKRWNYDGTIELLKQYDLGTVDIVDEDGDNVMEYFEGDLGKQLFQVDKK